MNTTELRDAFLAIWRQSDAYGVSYRDNPISAQTCALRMAQFVAEHQDELGDAAPVEVPKEDS